MLLPPPSMVTPALHEACLHIAAAPSACRIVGGPYEEMCAPWMGQLQVNPGLTPVGCLLAGKDAFQKAVASEAVKAVEEWTWPQAKRDPKPPSPYWFARG